MNTTAALKVIGLVMQTNNISHAELQAAFPKRPETDQEFLEVTNWLNEKIAKKAAVAVDKKPEWSQKAAASPSQPSSPQAKDNWDDITDGNYALPYNGKTHFYRVSRREGKGKWAGRTFVNVQERASDELYRVPFKRGLAIMHSIREYGVEKSHLLFSTELGQCWHCLKSLTDDTNPYKVHGLGPVCGPKVMG